MKKSIIFSVLILVIFSSLTLAEDSVDQKAVNCLNSKIAGKCSTLTLEQQIFSLLSMSHILTIQNECKTALMDSSKDSECWPKASCKIKETSQAILALNHISQNSDKPISWILNRTRTPTEIEWYLEIDTNENAQCTVNGNGFSIIDKQVSGNFGSCFSAANSNYWLKIDNTCIKNSINISCNKEFLSTILYKKPNSIIWHLSSDVQKSSANGNTQHKIVSSCFGLTSCEYESTLWAVFALDNSDKEISSYLPYLITLAEDNKQYFPSAFLNFLTTDNEFSQDILLSQSTLGFWDKNANGKFYDTALAILSLTSSETSNAKTKALEWLQQNQGTDGCWNSGNIRDTAMLLWAGWQKTAAKITPGTSNADCEDYNYNCIPSSECAESKGTKLNNYDCPSPNICCDKPTQAESCSDKGGEECSSDKQCSISVVSSSDTDECCLGECEDQTSECELAGKACFSSCASGYTSSIESCNSGKVCCVQKKSSYWWIYLLSVLIILIILAIIFRNKLKVALFMMKNKFKKSPVVKTRPPYPPMTPISPPQQRYSPRPQFRPASPPARTDRELDDTMRKLKEMSK